jgi:hypothetical protein
MWAIRIFVVLLTAATICGSGNAAIITITFSEGDQGVGVNLTNLPGCATPPTPPCVIGVVAGAAESASIDVRVAPNVFTVPAGGMAQAFQVESDGRTISDIVTLRVITAENRVNIMFQSDEEGSSLGQIPAGFVFSNIEGVGSSVDLRFFTGPANDPFQQSPYPLPVGPPDEYHIRSISDGDVVPPEPASFVLFGMGLVSLALLRRRSTGLRASGKLSKEA